MINFKFFLNLENCKSQYFFLLSLILIELPDHKRTRTHENWQKYCRKAKSERLIKSVSN